MIVSKDIGFYLRRPGRIASAFLLQISQKNTILCLNTELCMDLPKRNFKRRSKRKKGKNQKIYKRKTWKEVRAAYYHENPICELSEHHGDWRGNEKMVVDHIIPPEEGGSWYDKRNLNTLTKKIHDGVKTPYDRHHGVEIDYIVTDHGLIPRDKKDIWDLLKNRYLLWKKRNGEPID